MMTLLMSIALVVRLMGLNQSLWLDEAAQVLESIRPLFSQTDIVGDFWPPLYHILLHFWMQISLSDDWLRLLSVLLGLLSIAVFYKLTRSILKEKKAFLVVFLLSISPYHIWYSQEIRPYMLMVLMGVLSTYFLLHKKFLTYVLVTTLFLYTSYMATFLLIGHVIFIFVFYRKMWREWLLAYAFIFCSFLPWLPSLFKQLQIGRGLTSTLPGWSTAVSTPLTTALPLTFAKFILGRISFENKYFYSALIILLGLGYGVFILNAIKTKYKDKLKIFILIIVPLLSAFIFSFFLPIFAPQRLLFLLPFFYLIIGIGFNTKNKWHKLILALFIIVNIYSLWLYNTNPKFQREQWKEAVTYVEKNSTQNDLTIFVFPDAFAPWKWYSKGNVSTISVAPDITVKPADLFLLQIQPQVQKIYYFHYLTDLTDPRHLVVNYLIQLGFVETDKQDFPGVGFVSTYEKIVARI